MTEVDGYSSLPDELKEELRGLLSTSDPSLLLRHDYRNRKDKERMPLQQGGSSLDIAGSDSSVSSGDQDPNSVTVATEWVQFKMEEEFHDADTLEFQSSLDKLKVIVGSEAPEELLRDFLLAADMDINRAANYYFNTQLED